MDARYRLRQIVNVVNLSTPLGLMIAVAGRARPERGPDGLLIARGYRLPVPPAPAFTVGNVIMLRLSDERLARRPHLLGHEARHATQYAFCLGVVMLPLYVVAAGVSWVLTRDFASRNVFERRAGLASGGYRERPVRIRGIRRVRAGSPEGPSAGG
jgi:hypothetical protein